MHLGFVIDLVSVSEKPNTLWPMTRNYLQDKLLKTILAQYPKKAQAVMSLADLLSVGKDGIYRRIRSDTLLSPDEIYFLAKHFNISLDEIVFDHSNKLIFSYNLFAEKINSFEDYLKQIHHQITQVSQLPNVLIYYASQELAPFFYYFIPELAKFKLYVYGLTAWDLDFLKDEKFHFKLVSPLAEKMMGELVSLYNNLDTKDLWSQGMLDNTLNQIEFVALTDRFVDQNDALLLCDKLSELLTHLKRMAEVGGKFAMNANPESHRGSFDLYYNELVNTGNTILAVTDRGKFLYTTFVNPNFLLTIDPQLCNTIETWFKKTISRSTSISRHSGKSRSLFFNRLEKKVKTTRHRIELIIKEGNY